MSKLFYRGKSAVIRLSQLRLHNEPVDKCEQCMAESYCVLHQVYTHVSYEQAPVFMRSPYVQTGYRPQQISFTLCMKSILSKNNETVNIWLHIVHGIFFLKSFRCNSVGLAYFTLCQAYDNVYTLPAIGASWADHLIISVTLASFQLCMLLSVCYHIFSCVSEPVWRTTLSLDLLGISSAVLGSYLSGIYYAFYCHDTQHNAHMIVFGALSVCTFILPVYRRANEPIQAFGGRIALHHLVYITVIAYGLLPTVHWVVLHGGLGTFMVQRFVPNVLVVYALMVAAFAFYALSVPERFSPGKFDFIGWSHQWWHLLVLLAQIWWRIAGLDMLTFRISNSCSSVTLAQNL